MKTIYTLILISFLVLTGCENNITSFEEPVMTDGNALYKGGAAETGYAFSNTGTVEPVCLQGDDYGTYTYTLWAGKTNNAGTVTITNDDNNIYVTYNTNNTADLSEVHVYLWSNQLDIPSKRPAPGQADYVVENINADSYTVVIPAAVNCDNVYYISAHAALTVDNPSDVDEPGVGNNSGETAYGSGNNYPNGFPKGTGAWWGYMTFTVHCCDNGPVDPECQTETAWGGNTRGGGNAWWFYFDTQGTATQTIYAGQSINAGYVTFNGTQLVVTLTNGWELQNDDESVKVEGYDVIPSKRPAAGQFELYKGTSLNVNTDGSRYYAIHLDVQKCN